MKLHNWMMWIAVGSAVSWGQAAVFPVPEKSADAVFAGRKGAFVMIDCSAGVISRFNPAVAAERLPPCSTFKIWNTLIGLETGRVASPDEPFYKWDGQARFIPDWNKDLTLKEAFQASCVPAFQNLARKIGAREMQSWLDKLEFGDRDLSAGVDVFWLPTTGRKTVLISPEEQAGLITKLLSGKLPFSGKTQAVLRTIMLIRKTDRGVLYGKTGSGTDEAGQYNLGWFVGFVESNGKSYTFACVVRDGRLMGKDARGITESILEQSGFL